MPKKHLYKKIISNRIYDFKMIAELLKIHVRTVQTWHKDGLVVTNEASHPYLVMGYDLKQFLINRNSSRKVKLNEDEFYCLKCRCSTRSDRESLHYECTNKRVGKDKLQIIIHGKCITCGSEVNRFSSYSQNSQCMNKELVKGGKGIGSCFLNTDKDYNFFNDVKRSKK